MIYDWYKVINKSEFEATGLVSREVNLILEGVGQRTVLVTIGNYFSITYNGVMLSIGMTDSNPFAFGGCAVYLDANDDVWLGIETS
jgi:hypothetical protein